MPYICFDREVHSQVVQPNSGQSTAAITQDDLMRLLELCLTPGSHTLEFTDEELLNNTIDRIISALVPYMAIGVTGFQPELLQKSLPKIAVIERRNELCPMELDIIFINSGIKNELNFESDLTQHGTTITVAIKSDCEI